MNVNAAVEAYRQSAYQKAEYDIEASIGKASLPLIGGFFGSLKKIGNVLWRPFKVGGALLFGGDYPVDGIKPTEIPEDIQGSRYAEALVKVRDYAHQSADLRAEAWGGFLTGSWGTFFRKKRAARYTDNQCRLVLLPDERNNIVDAGVSAAPAVAVGLLTTKATINRMGSVQDDIAKNPEMSIGELQSQIYGANRPPLSANLLTGFGKWLAK